MATTQPQTKSSSVTVPLPARSLHWIVFIFLAAFGAICATFPVAMWRVSAMEKFSGFHVKSNNPGQKIAAPAANNQPQTPPNSSPASQPQTSQMQASLPSSATQQISKSPTASEEKAMPNLTNSEAKKDLFESRLESEKCSMAKPDADALTYVRSQPNPDAKIVRGIPEGEKMITIANEDVFVQVELQDGVKGWVYDDRIAPCNS